MDSRMTGSSYRIRLITSLVCMLALTANQHLSLAVSCMSHIEIRQKEVVIQSTEFACGAAAVATLMQYFFSIQVSESEVLARAEASMLLRGANPEEAHGLTAFDLKAASHAFGIGMAGYCINQGELADYFARGGLPVIAHLTYPHKHFVVVIGIRGTLLLIADPAWGQRVVGCSEFDSMRTERGVVLIPIPSQQRAEIAKAVQGQALLEMDGRLNQLQIIREEIY